MVGQRMGNAVVQQKRIRSIVGLLTNATCPTRGLTHIAH